MFSKLNSEDNLRELKQMFGITDEPVKEPEKKKIYNVCTKCGGSFENLIGGRKKCSFCGRIIEDTLN